MALFLLTFLCIYSGMHLLVWWGLRPLLSFLGIPPLPTILFMTLMTLAPVLVRLLDHGGWTLGARALAWIGYCWMGLLFIAFAAATVVTVTQLLLTLLGQGQAAQLFHSPGSAAVIASIALLGGIYGIIEARGLQTEEVRIVTSKLPADRQELRLVQISDLHLGLLNRERALKRVLDEVKTLDPDLLLVTGDLVDAQPSRLDGLSRQLAQVRPPLGKFAITGNHEVYAGLEKSLSFLKRGGFTVLRNRGVTIGNALHLVGVDDPATGSEAGEASLLRQGGSGLFTVLLKHRPLLDPQAEQLFDLQLSGHAHRGQIFPFNLLTGIYYPMQDGRYDLPWGGILYASRGTGCWGPPMRLLAPPEITLLRIVRGTTP